MGIKNYIKKEQLPTARSQVAYYQDRMVKLATLLEVKDERCLEDTENWEKTVTASISKDTIIYPKFDEVVERRHDIVEQLFDLPAYQRENSHSAIDRQSRHRAKRYRTIGEKHPQAQVVWSRAS